MDNEKITPEESANKPETYTSREAEILANAGLIPAENEPSRKGWSILFLILAIIFGIIGGPALVGLGIIFALISVVLAVYDLTNVIVHYNQKGK